MLRVRLVLTIGEGVNDVNKRKMNKDGVGSGQSFLQKLENYSEITIFQVGLWGKKESNMD